MPGVEVPRGENESMSETVMQLFAGAGGLNEPTMLLTVEEQVPLPPLSVTLQTCARSIFTPPSAGWLFPSPLYWPILLPPSAGVLKYTSTSGRSRRKSDSSSPHC